MEGKSPVIITNKPGLGISACSMKCPVRYNAKGFFLIPALDMQSPLRWWDWRRRLLAFLWLQDVKIESRSDVYSIWYRLKFICQELDNETARQLGHEIAQWTGRLSADQANSFRGRVSELLRMPSSTAKMANSLWKNYSHYRKVTGQEIPEIKSPEQLRNITTIAREMLLMERAAAEADIVFGTSPVLYSGRKKRAAGLSAENSSLSDT